MEGKIIGVDIGATKIKVGLVENSKVTEELEFPTLPHASKEEIISNLIKGIEKTGGNECSGIGIGVPGLVNEEEGIVYDLSNIPSWKEVHLKARLEEHFKKPVRITNDANVFAIGVKFFGNGSSYENLVGVSLGSGFGTGIIIHNKLYSGTLSCAGEMGDIPYLDKTIEDYCSGKFFQNEYGMNGVRVHEMAGANDKKALIIFEEFGRHLGKALRIILNVLSPEAIFFGGSVSKSHEYFMPSLREELKLFPYDRVLSKLVLQPSLIPNISVLGAAALIISLQQENRNFEKTSGKNN